MKLSRNRTGYFIKEGFSSIFNHSLMSFASICIIVAFLLIIGSFILISVNINAIIGDLESENIILAYVNEYLPEHEARALGAQLSRTPNVNRVEFITREQALYRFVGRLDDSARFEGIDSTWLRHRFSIFVDDVELISETMRDISAVYGIERVNANLTIAQAMVQLRNVVTIVSIVIIVVLLIISLFIMSNTIKLATYERREEIAIMRMVGATNSFIRWPFVTEGFILGFAGSMLAFVSLFGLYGLLAGRVYNFGAFFVNLLPFSNVQIPILLLFATIGFGVGVGGSTLALNRYLRV